MTTVLRLAGLGKRYSATSRGLFARGPRPEPTWALQGLDLELAAGEVVSVIGRNGAGKSTLLKLTTGVTTPTVGTVLRAPRVAPLIEVGAGFHPELSGRDNVLVNGRLLGLTNKEVAQAFDDIVGFSELGEVIDRPVRSYSSGMFMRLAFSVAIHTRPQLLLVDEVLAVGDLPFQVRCLDRIRELKENGVGILFVSHNLAAVQEISDRSLLLENGRCAKAGTPSDVIGAYHLALSREAASNPPIASAGTSQHSEAMHLLSCQLVDSEGSARESWAPSSPALLRIHVKAVRDSPRAVLGLVVSSEMSGLMMRWHSGREPLPALQAGEELEITIRLILALGAGGYGCDVSIASHDWKTGLMIRPQAVQFAVGHRQHAKGPVDLAPSLELRRVGGTGPGSS